MNPSMIAPYVIQRLAGSLLHFIWEGAIIAALAAAGFRLLRHRSAEARYALAVGSLAFMVAVPLLTVVFYSQAGALAQRMILAMDLVSTEARTTAAAFSASIWGERILLAWLAGVLVFASRLVIGWRLSWRLVRTAEAIFTPGVIEIFESVRERLRLRRPVRLLAHSSLDSPVVVGWLRPVIVLPVTLILGFSAEQLRAILAHELAHIRRHDFVVNILQRSVEAILFYHPAVWWLSKRIRAEREHCCDDMAIRLCGSRRIYAEALLVMERARQTRPILSVAAADGAVLQRFRRVLGMTTSGMEWQSAVATLVVLAVWAIVAMGQSSALLQASEAAATPASAPPAIVTAATASPVVAETVNAIAAILTGQPLAPVTGSQSPLPAAPPIEGQSITGRVAELPRGLPEGLIHVKLYRDFLMPNLRSTPSPIVVAEAGVADDGMFRFESVAPGRYEARVFDERQKVEVVAGVDVRNVVLNVEPVMYGHVTVDDGSPLPLEANSTSGDREAIATTRIQIRYAGRYPGYNREVTVPVRADGAFVAPLPVQGGSFLVTPIPIGYGVKSISYAGQDLLRKPLTAIPTPSTVHEGMRVLLTRQSPGFEVSGRITGRAVQDQNIASVLWLVSYTHGFEGTVTGVSETRPREDGSFTFHGVPAGNYHVRLHAEQTAVEVKDRDVTGIELTLPARNTSQIAEQLERAKRGVKEVFSETSMRPRPRFDGKSMEAILQDRIGVNPLDCGKFRLQGSLPPPLAVSSVASLAEALECARSSLAQRRPFFVVTVSNGFDDSHNDGVAGDANGTLFQFSSCTGACGGVVIEQCPPQSVLMDLEGSLVCEIPRQPVTRWPAPKQ